MKEWCMTHYWLTFFMICFLIYAIAYGVEQYFTVQNNKLKLEELKKNIEKNSKS